MMDVAASWGVFGALIVVTVAVVIVLLIHDDL